MTLASMTGFGRVDGAEAGVSWVWEMRSVNGRGLELRVRLPAGFEMLEPALREEAARHLRRGNVSASLSLRRDERSRIAVDRDLLSELLLIAADLREQIPGSVAPRVEGLLALPGVLRVDAAGEEMSSPELVGRLQEGFRQALAGLNATRREEGARLHVLIAGQLEAIETLRVRASDLAAQQPERQRARMMESLRNLLHDQPGLSQERIAQEVALLATKSDVREELDRLAAHVEAAFALLKDEAAVGRRFDFLVQEFVRETNTLCSKSATVELTAIGLQLKAVIEQMREQVQNVE